MAEADRNAQFEKISGILEAARERTTAAWQKTRDELASEVANAKDKASEQWHEIRGKRRGDGSKSSERPDG